MFKSIALVDVITQIISFIEHTPIHKGQTQTTEMLEMKKENPTFLLHLSYKKIKILSESNKYTIPFRYFFFLSVFFSFFSTRQFTMN